VTEGIDAITAISDEDRRCAALLGYIRALIILTTSVPKQAEDRGLLKLLQRRYVAVQKDEEGLIVKDLFDLLALAGAMMKTHFAKDDRIHAIMTCIQVFICMSDFDDIETKQLKKILRAVAIIPDEEFRAAESLERVESIVDALTGRSSANEKST
jgi:hypothetical protein